MVYTQARLEHALRVFRKASRIGKQRANSQSSRWCGRQLRNTTRVLRSVDWRMIEPPEGSDSDEYLPQKDKRRRKRKQRVVSKRKAADAVRDGDVHEEPRETYSTFIFSSADGKEKFKELSSLRREPGLALTVSSSGQPASRQKDASSTVVIEIDDSTSRESSPDATSSHNEPRIVSTPPNTPRPNSSEQSRFRDDRSGGLYQLLTYYSHPIDFRFIPKPGRDSATCDFCTNWKMGILGLGPRTTTVALDLNKPGQLIEIRNGHGAEGRPPTKMCVKCSLDRLLIKRCHRPPDQSSSTTISSMPASMTSQSAPRFTRLRRENITKAQQQAYLERLSLDNHTGNLGLTIPEATASPLPICSLCPMPADYRCCKWQERDKMKRPCVVPTVVGRPRTLQRGSISMGSSTPTSTTVTQTEVISLLSSDDEDENHTLPPSQAVPVSNRLAATTAPPLRPPLSGCGLLLCQICHHLVTRYCNGYLDKRIIMRDLKSRGISSGQDGSIGTLTGGGGGGGSSGYVFQGRADVEWLFAGSLLERDFRVK